MAQQTFTPLSNMEVSAFCSQMAMILHSGIFVMEGISIMLEDTLDPEEHALLVQVDQTLQETGILHEALRKTVKKQGNWTTFSQHYLLITTEKPLLRKPLKMRLPTRSLWSS